MKNISYLKDNYNIDKIYKLDVLVKNYFLYSTCILNMNIIRRN